LETTTQRPTRHHSYTTSPDGTEVRVSGYRAPTKGRDEKPVSEPASTVTSTLPVLPIVPAPSSHTIVTPPAMSIASHTVEVMSAVDAVLTVASLAASRAPYRTSCCWEMNQPKSTIPMTSIKSSGATKANSTRVAPRSR